MVTDPEPPPGQPFKLCPVCGQKHVLEAELCGSCGHRFRTQFANPAQTQAFGAAPPPPAAFQQGYPPGPYPSPYYRPAYPQSSTSNFPLWAAFLIGLVFPVGGIVLGVLFYCLDGMKNPEAGKMCFFGAAAGMILGCLCWVPLFLL